MVWAWLGAAAVGLSLGLLGSGGAILTVPILVFLMGHDEKSAITESLAIVGLIAFASAIRASLQRRVDLRSAALLAFPGIVGTFLGAHLAAHVSGAVQLVLLSLLMVTASGLMFRSGATAGVKSNDEAIDPVPGRPIWLIAFQGVALGFVTGFVGVGGGFLIVPVLVLAMGLAMQTAVGTSLAIIAVNSATGLVKNLSLIEISSRIGEPRVDWMIVLVFGAVGIAGSFLGNFLADHIPQRALKRAFAVFLLLMAGYILARQMPHAFPGMFAQKQPMTI